jgi:hypothetical protein
MGCSIIVANSFLNRFHIRYAVTALGVMAATEITTVSQLDARPIRHEPLTHLIARKPDG